jgi:tetratricopeptide (TPR) repeat protein
LHHSGASNTSSAQPSTSKALATQSTSKLSQQRGIELLVAHLDTVYTDAEAWQELAEVYSSLGLYQQALSALGDLILLQPQNPLPDFIRALPSNSFGTETWQSQLFESYRKLVLADPTLRSVHTQPLRRLTALEIGRSVQWLGRSESFKWLRELYRFVFGAYPEDTSQRNLIINA